ncbi:MAG: hypothetical protein K2K66_09295 [Ruminococcus sp.]|nr:hypothetical protein [Ruminococcus sp.]
MKKKLTKIAVGVTVIASILTCSMTAYATTIDDVADVARQLGTYSEDTIQQAYAHYYANPDKYTSEDFDEAIAALYSTNEIIMTTGEQNPEPVTFPTTTAVPAPEVSNNNSEIGGNETQPENTGGVTLQTNNGEEFTRITPEEFIAMSYDDKMNYVRNFTPEQQQVILDNLTIEERKSLMKQLPVEQKAEVVNSIANFGETLDINISVEEISEDNISLSMRNDDGEIVGMVNAGVIVEDTGYDRRGILALSAGLIAVAGVLAGAVSRLFKTGDEK